MNIRDSVDELHDITSCLSAIRGLVCCSDSLDHITANDLYYLMDLVITRQTQIIDKIAR